MPLSATLTRTRIVIALAFAPGVIVGCALVGGVDFDAAREPAADAAATRPADDASVGTASTDAGGADRASGDAASAADAADAADPCDQDGDGYRSLACDGSDCDDTDNRAHPDAGFVTVLPTAPRFGDWNCDGTVEKRYRTNASCDAPVDVSCALRDGFTGDPDCGVTAPFVNCSLSGGNCVVLTTPTRTQGCR